MEKTKEMDEERSTVNISHFLYHGRARASFRASFRSLLEVKACMSCCLKAKLQWVLKRRDKR